MCIIFIFYSKTKRVRIVVGASYENDLSILQTKINKENVAN